MPPTAADQTVEAFEQDIRARGESRARWDALMNLLAGNKNEGQAA